MTKLGVITDSHRSWRNIDSALPFFADCKHIIHLGDHEGDMDDFPEAASRLLRVSGNCDFFSMQPGTRYIEVEGIRVMLTHGHAYGVKRGLDDLCAAAVKGNCALALYGHTHERRDIVKNGVRMVNPGALKDGCYAIVSIDGGGITVDMRNV